MSTQENELRLHRCCFTGHQPEKLEMKEEQIRPILMREIRWAVEDGYRTFITGMSPGVDIWAAGIIVEIKEFRNDIHLIAAVPYPGYGKTRDYRRNLQYKRVIERADYIKEICPVKQDNCFLLRDRWMIDHSNRIIALYNGTPDGTRQAMEYAEKKGIEIKLENIK